MNIIFDFDGVIINSHKIKSLAFFYIFRVYGKTIGLRARKYHLDNIGKSRYLKFKHIIKNIQKSKITQKKLHYLDKKFDNFLQKKLKKMTPSKNLILFLKNKKNKRKMFISTGTPKNKIIKILKEKNLIKYFSKVYGSPKSKNNHIKEIKKNGERTLFIGDSFEDYQAAKFSNVEFILKINSENVNLRKKIKLNKINSFKYLENKIG